jgi:hypothetical protein
MTVSQEQSAVSSRRSQQAAVSKEVKQLNTKALFGLELSARECARECRRGLEDGSLPRAEC